MIAQGLRNVPPGWCEVKLPAGLQALQLEFSCQARCFIQTRSRCSDFQILMGRCAGMGGVQAQQRDCRVQPAGKDQVRRGRPPAERSGDRLSFVVVVHAGQIAPAKVTSDLAEQRGHALSQNLPLGFPSTIPFAAVHGKPTFFDDSRRESQLGGEVSVMCRLCPLALISPAPSMIRKISHR